MTASCPAPAPWRAWEVLPAPTPSGADILTSQRGASEQHCSRQSHATSRAPAPQTAAGKGTSPSCYPCHKTSPPVPHKGRKMPTAHLPGGPSPGAQRRSRSCSRLVQAGRCCSRARCVLEPGTSCPSPPLPVTQPPHRPCRSEAGHRSSPAGSTGSQGRKQRNSGRHHSSHDGRASPVPQPATAAPSPAQPPLPHGLPAMPARAGSSALPLLAGTGSLAEAKLVALGAPEAGTPWTHGCPALARCRSGCVLRVPPPGNEQQTAVGQGHAQSLGLGVWGCPRRL